MPRSRGNPSSEDRPAGPAFDPDRFGMDPTAAPPDARPPDRPRRGRAVGVLALVAAVIGAVLLGVTTYAAFDAVDVVSLDPLGSAWGWIVGFGAVAVGAFGVVVFAIGALAWCRPRGTAGLALVASIVLPVLAVALAGSLGLATAKLHAAADLTADGGLVDNAADVVQTWNVDVGPFRELLKSIVTASG